MQSSREDAATPTHEMDTDDDEQDDDDDDGDVDDYEDDDDVLYGVREMLNVSLVDGYDGDNEDDLDCKYERIKFSAVSLLTQNMQIICAQFLYLRIMNSVLSRQNKQ